MYLYLQTKQTIQINTKKFLKDNILKTYKKSSDYLEKSINILKPRILLRSQNSVTG